ncbi:MAG: L-ribulose-5-phosphate 3-epimerase [Clostridiales bacterium]|nr:L-ribulose-5-phosphate 3-epimerase [Clostridiales bacterium]
MKEYSLGLYEKAMPAELKWREKLHSAQKAGFDFIEISIDETQERLERLNWTKEERLSLVKAGVEVGLPVRTMCLSGSRKYPLGSRDILIRQRGMNIVRKAIELACDIGVRIIQSAGYDVYYEQGDEQTRAYFRENIGRAVNIAACHGVTLGFETMETSFMDTISKGIEYVHALSSPYLGMYPDLGNLTNGTKRYGLSVAKEMRIGQGHLLAMHLKETKTGKYRDMSFGSGHVDFENGIAVAMSAGVRLFVAESWYDGNQNWQEELESANRFLRRCFHPHRPSKKLSSKEVLFLYCVFTRCFSLYLRG